MSHFYFMQYSRIYLQPQSHCDQTFDCYWDIMDEYIKKHYV